MVPIDVTGMDYQAVNNKLQTMPGDCELINCCGQRFIGAGMADREILIRGTPGNALGAYLNGAEITVCGNAQEGRRTPWVFFRDDVNEHLLQRRLMKYAAERECNATDVNLFNNAEVLMSIGIGGVSLPVPYLISYRELQYSCSLVAKEKPNEDASKSGKPNEVSSESPKRDTKKLNEEMRRLLNNIPDGDEQ